MADTKECPQCAEDVKARAKICRFCGHTFAAPAAAATAVDVDTDGAATVIFVGRVHGGPTEPTWLRMQFFEPSGDKYTEFKPLAIAGCGVWQPRGEVLFATPGATGRSAIPCAHTLYDMDSKQAEVDAPFQVEVLVPAGRRLELGWVPMMHRQDGVATIDPAGCGTAPVLLEPGQTVVIDVGPVLGWRGMDGHANLGHAGPPGTNRRTPVVSIAPADTAAQAARWSATEPTEVPAGKPLDAMLVVLGEAARQRWGHGESIWQADAAGSGAAMGNLLGAKYAENKRKKELLTTARATLTALVASAEPGSCALLDERLARRDGNADATQAADAALAEGEDVQRAWDRLTAVVDSCQKAVDNANGPVNAFAPRLGEALEAAVARGQTVEGAGELAEIGAEMRKLKAEHSELDNVSGFFAKAKAAAQQVALMAQIAFAENKLKGARNAAAQALLDAGQEGNVPDADALLGEIAQARAQAAAAVDKLGEAKEARATETPALAARLGLDSMPPGGPKAEVARRRSDVQRLADERQNWVEHTTTALMDAGPDGWPAEGPLRDALQDLASKIALS